MRRSARAGRNFIVLALAALSLSGCLRVSHPFRDPGREGRHLVANTPPPRLAVPYPTEAMLNPRAARFWRQEFTRDLVAQTLPAVARSVKPGDWWVRMTVSFDAGYVVPHFFIMTPKGEACGHGDGAPIRRSLWTQGNRRMLHNLAGTMAPDLARVLTGIQAAMMQADPGSLKRRAARIYFLGVSGAPGDGNRSLARAFVAAFPDPLNHLTHDRKKADFIVSAHVNLHSSNGPTKRPVMQHIEIVWRIRASDGKEAGAETQLHDIEPHSLDGAWGDVAAAAAEEAAGGARQIITNYSGRAHKPLPANER